MKFFYKELLPRIVLLFFLIIVQLKTVQAEKFTVTGYYSPLPNQEFYLTGNYESELRLNGKGIISADGTKVYHGMIAAPKNYKFGTKLCLEKLGCGTVHDRGSAIVNKGVRKKAVHDRLDFWMGYGTEGLIKSLLWGVQNVKGNFHKNNYKPKIRTLKERKSIQSPIFLEIIREKKLKKIFRKNIYPGSKGDHVLKIKEALKFLNFMSGKLNNQYDGNLKKHLTSFQIKHAVISNPKERGAGNFGPKTREKMEEVIRKSVIMKQYLNWNTEVFKKNIKYGEHSIDVFRLQQILLEKGFFKATPTGYFGEKTREALKDFQILYGITKNRKEIGSGDFGPKSREKIMKLWLEKRDNLFPIQKEKKLVNEENNKELKLFFLLEKDRNELENDFEESVILFRGKRNENVRKLQKKLKKLEFFEGKATGFYGDKTAEAVLSFQYKHNIVDSRKSLGAAIFGPATRKKMNEVI